MISRSIHLFPSQPETLRNVTCAGHTHHAHSYYKIVGVVEEAIYSNNSAHPLIATVYQLHNIMAALSFVKFITSTIVLVAAVVAWSCDKEMGRSG